MVKKNPKTSSESLSGRVPNRRLTRDVRATLAALDKLLSPPLGGREDIAEAIRELGAAFSKLDDVPFSEVLSALDDLARKDRKRQGPNIANRSFAGLSIAEVERLLSEDAATKADLLRLARERFEVSTGTLVRLSRKQLARRLETLARNERTHDTLARLAGDGGPQIRDNGAPSSRSVFEVASDSRRGSASIHSDESRDVFESRAKDWAMGAKAALQSGKGNTVIVEERDRAFAMWAVRSGYLVWDPAGEGVMLPGAYAQKGRAI